MTEKEELNLELAELHEGPVEQYLRNKIQEAIQAWTHSTDEKKDMILKGRKQVLDEMISDIQTARDVLRREREKQSSQPKPRSAMSRSF